jgi:hypothetical protein
LPDISVMSFLGGYDSDDEDGAEEQTALPSASSSLASAGNASPDSTGSDGGATEVPKKKKIDYSKLPISRPLSLDTPAPTAAEEEAPLKKAAELADKGGFGRSLLAAIPPPKVTLGRDAGSGSVRIDLSDIRPAREKPRVLPVADLLRPEHAPDFVDEINEVPANLANHRMFSVDSQGSTIDGPTSEELEELRAAAKNRQFVKISADDMKDPDWYMKNQIAAPGLKGKTVPDEVSSYDSNGWRKTTHAIPSRVQKRKHQINWLANEAMEKEAEMLDRGANNKLSKAQTSLKYGW